MEITLSDIAERLPQAKPYGHYYMGLCPFHLDRRPSLMVSSKRYKCKGCGARGSLAKLYKKLNPSDPRLREAPPKRFGSRVFPQYSDIDEVRIRLLNAHDRLAMDEGTLHAGLNKRGIHAGLVLSYELGWWDNWYTFPIKSERGEIIGGVARANEALENKGVDKYDMPWGQPPMLYIPNWTLWRKSDIVFIAFGILDAITLASLGFAAASPTAGQDSTDPRWLDNVRKNIYVVPDRNETEAGIALARKLGFRGKVLGLPYDNFRKDPNDFLRTGHERELIQAIEKSTRR
jgi:DNA primase